MFHSAAMTAYSKGLENALKKYIDNRADGKKELRRLLQQTSSVDRYSLLMNVRGDKHDNTGVEIAALYNDLETMKCMLEGFTVDEKYNVLKIQSGYSNSALYYAAENGNSSIITYLNNKSIIYFNYRMMMEKHLCTKQHLSGNQKQFKLS